MKTAYRPPHLFRPHPSEPFKRRFLAKNQMQLSEVANELDLTLHKLNLFIEGKLRVDLTLATHLEKLTGISYQCWRSYLKSYDNYYLNKK